MDLTWTNPAAYRRVSSWDMSPEETLSDHFYILMEVAVGGAMGDRSFSVHGPIGPPGRRRRFPRWAGTAIALLYTSWVLVPDRRRRGGGSDPAEVRHVRDLRFVYAAARRPAPRSCGVLVVRGDRSCPRGVYPRSAPVHQNPPLAAGGRSYGSSSVQGLPRSAETPATSHQGGEEAGLGRVSGQPRLRSLVAPLQDSIEQTPPMGTSRNREHGPSVPRGGRQYCVPGSGKRGRWQVCR